MRVDNGDWHGCPHGGQHLDASSMGVTVPVSGCPCAPLDVFYITGNDVSSLPSGIARYYIALHHQK